MDKTDHQILNLIQDDFPLVSRPYEALAKNINLTETEFIEKINRLIESGVIRGMGAIVDTSKFGYYGTLVAAKIPPEKLEETGNFVSQFKEITHNYERGHIYNLWFTVTASTKERALEIIDEIKIFAKTNEIYELGAKKKYKIKVKFNVG